MSPALAIITDREGGAALDIEGAPTGWNVKRLKYAVQIINKKVDAKEHDLPFMGLEHIEPWTGRKIEDETAASEGIANLYQPNDLLFGKLRPYLAKVYLSQETGLCTAEALVLRSYNENDPRYLRYQLATEYFIDLVNSSTYGSKMPRANWDFIGNMPTLLPPKKEQTAIADYLDKKTKEVDELISKKEQLLAFLDEQRTALIARATTKGLNPNVSMQETGTEWLGKIPTHWEMNKIKRISSYIGSGKTPRGGSEVYVQEGIMLLRSQNIYDDLLKLDDVVYITEEMDAAQSNTRLQPKDALLNITGASIGRANIVPENFPRANVNQHVCIIRPQLEKIVPNYLHLLLCSKLIKDQIASYENGSSREGLNFKQVGNLDFPLPPVDEQKSIVADVNRRKIQLLESCKKINLAIQKLKEYRTALITNAVAGKIKVV